MRAQLLALTLSLLMLTASLLPYGSGAAPVEQSSPLGLEGALRTSPDGVRYRLFSGDVASFDGLPLAADVTLPAQGSGPFPLLVMFHGWGQDRSYWRSETSTGSDAVRADWNNVAFAARGYAVLTYTARGFHDSCGPADARDPANAATLPSECLTRQYWIHLADPRWEMRDAQYLIGRLVDDGVADPQRIGLTGQSYGGAHAWWLALLNDRTYDPQHGAGLSAWTSPRGTPLRIAAAAPLYTWSSLGAALLPNGRADQHSPGSPETLNNPVGVPLDSYITGFFASGAAVGFYSPPGVDPSADLPAWYARVRLGNPFRNDPVLDPLMFQALQQLDRRSPLFQQPDDRVPIFQVQGYTDPLFPVGQGLQMRNHVLAWDADYPITSIYGDLGHSYASNPPDVWKRIHRAGHAFFDHYLRGLGARPANDVTALTTTCHPGQPRRALRATGWPALSTGSLTFTSRQLQITSSTPAGDGPATDPIVTSGCISLPQQPNGAAAWTFSPGTGYVILGQPEVRLLLTPSAGDVTLNTRLWDVSPDGATRTLISRGTYRLLSAPLQQTAVSFEIMGNAWELLPGHSLRLEVLGSDSPYYQANNIPATIAIAEVELAVPGRALARRYLPALERR